ncbi:unnamed protein product [Sympodiomycopsis kandeliae]
MTSASPATSAARTPGPWERLAQRWPDGRSANDADETTSRFGPRQMVSATAANDERLAAQMQSIHFDRFRHRHRVASTGDMMRNKPLPPLPPARTPSQFHHQRKLSLDRDARSRAVDALHRSQLRLPSAPLVIAASGSDRSSNQAPSGSRAVSVSTASSAESSTIPRPGSSLRPPSAANAQPLAPQRNNMSQVSEQRSRPQRVDSVQRRPNSSIPVQSSLGPLPEIPQGRPATPGRSNQSPQPPSYDILFGPPQPPRTPERSSRTLTSSEANGAEPGPSRLPIGHDSSPDQRPGQCWGIKRDGERCTRIVVSAANRNSRTPSPAKPAVRRCRYASEPPQRAGNREGDIDRPIIIDNSDPEDDSVQGSFGRGSLPLYCHQHAKEINKSPGFHLGISQEYISFDTFIPGDLSSNCQARLRTTMSESFSAADQESTGYIYIYEVINNHSSSSRSIRLKIGRSHQPMNRVAQWRSQCSSLKSVLRCLYPTDNNSGRQGLIVGASSVSAKGIQGSHKWEKLIHIELAERCPRPVQGKCTDCGKVHREIFNVDVDTCGFEGVDEVVQRWEKFIRKAVNGTTQQSMGLSGN